MPTAVGTDSRTGSFVRNELISKGIPYQLESKRYTTIVHERVIGLSLHTSTITCTVVPRV